MQYWDSISDQELHDAGIFKLIRSHRVTREKDKEFHFHIISSLDWVHVIPVLREGQDEDIFVMVRQFRQGISNTTLEFPGGILEKGESPITAGIRELREESGCVPNGDLVFLGSHYPNPALFDNACHTYVVEVHQERTELDLDDTESVEVVHISARELLESPLKFGFTNDTMMASLLLYQEYLKKR